MRPHTTFRPTDDHTIEMIWRLLVTLGMLLVLAAGAVLAVFSVWIGELQLLVGTAVALIVLQGFLASLFFIADRDRAAGARTGGAAAFAVLLFSFAFVISDPQALVAVPAFWALAFGAASAAYRQSSTAAVGVGGTTAVASAPERSDDDTGSRELAGLL